MSVCAHMLTCTFGGKRSFPESILSFYYGLWGSDSFICLAISLFIHLIFWGRVSWNLEFAHLPRFTGQGSAWPYPSSSWVTDSICCGCLGIKFRVSRLHANHLSEWDISSVPLPLPFFVLMIKPRASLLDSTLTLSYSPSLPTGCFWILDWSANWKRRLYFGPYVVYPRIAFERSGPREGFFRWNVFFAVSVK